MPTTWRVNNSTNLGGEPCAQWVPSHAYSLGARVVCRRTYSTGSWGARAFVYECTDAGTSHATTEPTWPTTVGNTVVEDTVDDVTWTCRSPGDGTWDNATCILMYILTKACAAGDTILIDDGHSENVEFNTIYQGSATPASPLLIYCVDKADDSLSEGAIVQNGAGTSNTAAFSGHAYCYGVTFKFPGNASISDSSYSAKWTIEGSGSTVLLQLLTSAKSFTFGTGTRSSHLIIKNGVLAFDLANQTLAFGGGGGLFFAKNMTITAPNGITGLIAGSGYTRYVIIQDSDLSGIGNGAAATSILVLTNNFVGHIVCERCKLPSDAGFTITSGSWPQPGHVPIRLHHCSSGNYYYDFYEESYYGTVEDETTIVRTGGASDGTTTHSFKMTSTAQTLDNFLVLESPPITIWNSATTEKTFTIECIWDSATNIQDDEIWMELEYPANATDGLGAIATDKCAVFGTPADQATSVLNWENEDDLTNPNTFKLSVTVTPGKAAPVTARIYLAKASTTIYVDPKITIS